MASLSQNNLALKLVLENLLCLALEVAYGSSLLIEAGDAGNVAIDKLENDHTLLLHPETQGLDFSNIRILYKS